MADEVVVVSREHGLPYSKGLMAQSMMAAGLPPGRSWELARAVEGRLAERGEPTIAVPELRELAETVLGDEVGEEAVRRFRQWQRLGRLDIPLVVLIGGAAGTGKSTLATLLAHRLGVTRVIATDTIRQVLRAFFARDFMPAVHYSSFEAGAAVRHFTAKDEDPDLRGFLRQAENVGTGILAILERSVAERQRIIVEGVHLIPGSLPEAIAERALVVRVMLSVADDDLHRSHFHLRGSAPDRGPAERYLEHFDTIRKLQAHLIERAQRAGVPVIDNQALDASLSALLDLVLDAVAAAEPATSGASR